MNKYLLILSLCIFVSGVASRCVEKPKYGPNAKKNTDAPFTKCESTAIMKVYAKDNITLQQWETTYWPRVDEFSQMNVVGTYAQGFPFNQNLTVWVELIANRTSKTNVTTIRLVTEERKVYTEDLEKPVFIPYFTVLILMDKGIPTDMQWDEGCSSCSPDVCINGTTCGTRTNLEIEKRNEQCSKIDCNIKVFVAWTGRDKEDGACRSAASMPSKFHQYSVTPLTSFGDNLWDDFFYNWRENAPNPRTD